MRKRRVLRRGERGQGLLEFALAGLGLFMLILGTIDVGRAVWNYNTLAQATREGTRYAIVHGVHSSDPSGPGSSYYTPPNQDTKVTERVQTFAKGLDPALLTVEAEWPDGTNEVNQRIRVTSRYTYEPMFDFLGIASFDITSSSTMSIAH